VFVFRINDFFIHFKIHECNLNAILNAIINTIINANINAIINAIINANINAIIRLSVLHYLKYFRLD
jgi:hypothetical protein